MAHVYPLRPEESAPGHEGGLDRARARKAKLGIMSEGIFLNHGSEKTRSAQVLIPRPSRSATPSWPFSQKSCTVSVP